MIINTQFHKKNQKKNLETTLTLHNSYWMVLLILQEARKFFQPRERKKQVKINQCRSHLIKKKSIAIKNTERHTGHGRMLNFAVSGMHEKTTESQTIYLVYILCVREQMRTVLQTRMNCIRIFTYAQPRYIFLPPRLPNRNRRILICSTAEAGTAVSLRNEKNMNRDVFYSSEASF